MKAKKFAVSACAVLLLAGCETLDSKPAPVISADTVTADTITVGTIEATEIKIKPEDVVKLAGKVTSGLRLTRYLGLKDPAHTKACIGSKCLASDPHAYTSIQVSTSGLTFQTGGSNSNQDYANKNGSFLKRALSPETNTFIMTIYIQVNGVASFAVPQYLLLTRDDKTKSWSTEIVSSRIASTFFQAKPDTTVSVQFATSSQELTDPRYAKLLFQTAENIAEVTIPGSKFATTLAKPSTDKTQLLIDNTLKTLMSGTESEKISAETTLDQLKESDQWEASIFLPNQSTNTMDNVGTWYIRFSPPRPSMFSSIAYTADDDTPTERQARRKEAYERLSASNILDTLKIGDNAATLRTLLQSQSWFTDGLSKASATTSATITEGVNIICEYTRETLDREEIALNYHDKAAVTWALLKQVQWGVDGTTVDTALKAATDSCKAVTADLKEIGLVS